MLFNKPLFSYCIILLLWTTKSAASKVLPSLADAHLSLGQAVLHGDAQIDGPQDQTSLPDGGATFVANLSSCPVLPARNVRPVNVHDLRPDDFSVIMAVGDSITAAAFAEGVQEDVLENLAEWRGKSYAGGGDPGAVTVPNLLSHYNPGIQGGSVGKNLVLEICLGPICAPTGWNSKVDQLNAARTGAVARNLVHEIRDYLIPQLAKKNIRDEEFKYLSFQIGSNDICQMCLSDVFRWDWFPGSASAFESEVVAALEYVRKHIPNTVVNLMGIFKVSDVWQLTRGHAAYCHKGFRDLPHYTFECACALQEGPLGDFYRRQMDELQEKYNERLLRIIKTYQQLDDPSFAVLWQPAVVPLSKYPIEAVSDVDCFHPSTASHERIAAGIWNRLTLNSTERSQEFSWSEKVTLRCLEEEDRLQTRAVWEE